MKTEKAIIKKSEKIKKSFLFSADGFKSIDTPAYFAKDFLITAQISSTSSLLIVVLLARQSPSL